MYQYGLIEQPHLLKVCIGLHGRKKQEEEKKKQEEADRKAREVRRCNDVFWGGEFDG